MKFMSLRMKVSAAMFLGAMTFGLLPEPVGVVTLQAASCVLRSDGVAADCVGAGGVVTENRCNNLTGNGHVTCSSCNAACRSTVVASCLSFAGSVVSTPPLSKVDCNWP